MPEGSSSAKCGGEGSDPQVVKGKVAFILIEGSPLIIKLSAHTKVFFSVFEPQRERGS